MSPEKSPRQPRKPFQNLGKKEDTPRPERKRIGRSENRVEKPFKPRVKEDRPSKPLFKKDKPFKSREEGDRPEKRFEKREKTFKPREEGDRPIRRFTKGEKTFKPREEGDRPAKRFEKREKPFRSGEEGDRPVKKFVKREKSFEPGEAGSRPVKKYATRSGKRIIAGESSKAGTRLNKYIANSGVCSRREADELIKAGVVKVNGVVITELGSRVMSGDKVQYGDQTLNSEKKRYLLLNKQKGYVTTTKDPHAKNTVMELIEGACKERIYPVGRLDRNTTGLLLFTNDGELAKKLMHPRSRIKKMYHVVLDQPLSKGNMLQIAGGIELDGELIQVDSIDYVEDASDRREIGMEIHSGQNRVVRRLFESLGHKVVKLDRVMYAGLTKKNIPRGKWRFLSEKEVITLLMMR